MELSQHYYNPDRQHLINLGYQPSHSLQAEVQFMLQDLLPFKDRIAERQNVLLPDIRWDGNHHHSKIIDEPVAPPQH
jgi:UDP-sulfoquinovose synthase